MSYLLTCEYENYTKFQVLLIKYNLINTTVGYFYQDGIVKYDRSSTSQIDG
jgi:hypothetical protein